ncbi:MFS transporter [Streptomyces abyssalis]|uniref:Putative proline/betaine transporter n=1 Tax=Streptomyces abyssalis TaxID=933944 RepID=A0A1E7JPE0_9ACTN|nr:MFS transporter [Streptomyces abyssalis]OEU90149.1 MFS transporter [Streptomyces abyssalis]OEU94882.1 MFS transporter [Streptomyces abyssalis]OEV31903.1 MFS transporter [Streptomyces nanshensis]
MPGNLSNSGRFDGNDPEAVKRHQALFRAIRRRRHPAWRRSDITVTDERSVRRAVRAAALGNAMEWYDFGVYAYLAVTIGDVFFSGLSGGARTLASLGTFALTFAVRPFGGLFFGPLGDRIGRRKVLAATIILMASATFCVGLIPSYGTIGVLAPVLLIFFRLLQGFSTGGEYGGASTFIAEYASDRKRGFFGSFLELGTLVGYACAASIAAVLQVTLSEGDLVSWGWRIPFLLGGPLGVVGLYLRLKLDETPAYRRLASETGGMTQDGEAPGGSPAAQPHLPEHSHKKELVTIFKDQWRVLMLCIVLVAAYNVTDYMLLSYMPTYLTDTLDYPASHGTFILVGTMVLMICVINHVGRLNDRYGRKPLLMTGMLGFVVLTVPAFLLLRQGSLPAVICGMLMLGFSLVCLLGTMSATLPALFSTDVRYGSLAIGYNVSVAVFGGTTPLVMDGLVTLTHNDLMPAFYTTLFAVVGVVAVLVMKETARQPLKGSPPSVASAAEAKELARQSQGAGRSRQSQGAGRSAL